ncbi:FadR/GntR family transcriptional regulator [Rhodococcus triatomae]
MDTLARIPLSQRAAQALMDEVTNGTWQVGDQLPAETALAAQLGVGRSTIREAIRQLVARRILTTRHGVGVFVASTSAVEEWNHLAEVGAIGDVLQVRIAIESRAASLAAAEHTDSDVATIRTALAERNARQHATAAELAAHDIRFHRTVVVASHNHLLVSLFDTLEPRLVTAMTSLLELLADRPADADDHVAVVDAVLDRRPDDAERLTREHLLGVAAALEALS